MIHHSLNGSHRFGVVSFLPAIRTLVEPKIGDGERFAVEGVLEVAPHQFDCIAAACGTFGDSELHASNINKSSNSVYFTR